MGNNPLNGRACTLKADFRRFGSSSKVAIYAYSIDKDNHISRTSDIVLYGGYVVLCTLSQFGKIFCHDCLKYLAYGICMAWNINYQPKFRNKYSLA